MDVEEAAAAGYERGHLLDGDTIRAIIAAAYPWRPVSEDMPRNVVVQVRVPGSDTVRLAAVHDVHGASVVETVALGRGWAGVGARGFVALDTPRRELSVLIAAGAEYRMLPE